MLELTDAAKVQIHQSLAVMPMPGREGKCFKVVPKNDKFVTLRRRTDLGHTSGRARFAPMCEWGGTRYE